VPAVRPEFGPTLPELLRPWLRAHPCAGRAGAAVLIVAAVVGVALAVRAGGATEEAVVRSPSITFNLIYPEGLERVSPRRGELLRLANPPAAGATLSYVVRPVALPPYRGDINGFLPLFTARLIADMRRVYARFALRGEGRVRINDVPGYGVQFQARIGGRLFFGRRLLLFPDEPGARHGADVLLLASASLAVPNVDAVGNAGPLKTALRSFRFGTERP
jgi:hypothetical protein